MSATRIGESVSVRHARLTLLERDSGKPLTKAQARRYVEAAEVIQKAEANAAARWTALCDAYGVPRTSTPVKASTPTGARRMTAAEVLAHFRARVGDERTDPGAWAALPAHFQRILVREKEKAGERLDAGERRAMTGGMEYFNTHSKLTVKGR